jgi:hypothetical protein
MWRTCYPQRSTAEPAALDGGFEVSRFRGSEVRDPGVRRFDVVWSFRAPARSGKAVVQPPASQTPERRNPVASEGKPATVSSRKEDLY